MTGARPNPPSSANASPESLSTTRRHLDGEVRGSSPESLATRRLADLDLREADDRRPGEELADGDLVVLGVGLLEEADLLEVAVQPALDDLGEGLLGLALVAGEEAGAGEGDVHGDVVGQLRVAAGKLYEHGVDATLVLDVEVGVEHVL